MAVPRPKKLAPAAVNLTSPNRSVTDMEVMDVTSEEITELTLSEVAQITKKSLREDLRSAKHSLDPLQRQSTIASTEVAQLQKMNEKGSVWNAVKEGDLKWLQKMELSIDPLALGAFGETILHVALLCHQNKVSKFLIRRFPELVNMQYQKAEYYGENALHIAVVNRDLEMTEFLLQNGADPNRGLATGNFFRPNGGTVYYGCHVIAFAVCTKQPEMIRLLSKYGANLDIVDKPLRNTLFHHAVRVDCIETLDTLLELAVEKNIHFRKTYRQLSEANEFSMKCLDTLVNANGFTVFQYAAHLGHIKIFEYLLEQMKIVGWSWGDIAFQAYPIGLIDTHGDNPHSVLETIITEQHAHFMNNTVVHEVLMQKWRAYGSALFTGWFVAHLLYCALESVSFLLWPFDLTVSELSQFPIPLLGSICVMLAKALTLIISEIQEFYLLHQEHGVHRAWHIYFERGQEKSGLSVTGLFKLSSWFGNIGTLTVLCFFAFGNYEGVRSAMTFTLLMDWLHTLMFAQALKSTGRLVLTISKILIGDVTRFVLIYLVLLCAFSTAFLLLHADPDQISYKNVTTEWIREMFIMYQLSLAIGDYGFDDFTNEWDRVVAQITFVFFLLLSTVMLFNLLIAVMTETTESVRESAIEQWLLQWASTVLLIERRVPRCFYKRTGIKGSNFGFQDRSKEYFITFTTVTKPEHALAPVSHEESVERLR